MDKPGWYDAYVDSCASVNDIAGSVVGAVYGEGALGISGDPDFARAVSGIIDHQVSSGWADMCDLPENLGLFDGGGADGVGMGAGVDTGGADSSSSHDAGGDI